MNEPDLTQIPGILLDGDEPVFNEPWEAQAFAIVLRLHERGVFAWNEWAEVLGGVIRRNSNSTPYYHSWLQALETPVPFRSAPVKTAA